MASAAFELDATHFEKRAAAFAEIFQGDGGTPGGGSELEGRTSDEMPQSREPPDGTKVRRSGRSLPVAL